MTAWELLKQKAQNRDGTAWDLLQAIDLSFIAAMSQEQTIHDVILGTSIDVAELGVDYTNIILSGTIEETNLTASIIDDVLSGNIYV